MVVLNESGEVRAAGGVVTRHESGRDEILVVHRPGYDDWSLPKGKVDGEETDEVAAVREVEEETGFRTELLDELPTVRYADRYGRAKAVRYWRMRVIGGSFLPNREVDEIAWLPLDRAIDVLTYERDAALIRTLPHAAVDERAFGGDPA